MIKDENIEYAIDCKEETRMFAAMGVAPCDVFEDQDFWALAKQKCFYDNRAYFCEPAAAFDRILIKNGKWNKKSKGWPLKFGHDPFDRSELEIAEQAKHFCYRCGMCSNIDQNVKEPFVLSKTNENDLHL